MLNGLIKLRKEFVLRHSLRVLERGHINWEGFFGTVYVLPEIGEITRQYPEKIPDVVTILVDIHRASNDSIQGVFACRAIGYIGLHEAGYELAHATLKKISGTTAGEEISRIEKNQKGREIFPYMTRV